MSQTSFADYLIELRGRLLYCCGFLFFMFALLFYFAKNLFAYLALPLIKQLPQGSHLIATSITSPLFTPLNLSFLLAIALSVPFFLYQLWSFITPALYKEEKRLMWLLLVPGIALFYIGMSFAYFVVFPLIFSFFAGFVPQGVMLLPDIAQYLQFSLKLFLAFGLVFEVPVITLALVLCRITTPQQLAQARPYVMVMSFIIGMFLTPPDVLSQILLAIPICLLYEIGIVLSRFVYAKRQQTQVES